MNNDSDDTQTDDYGQDILASLNTISDKMDAVLDSVDGGDASKKLVDHVELSDIHIKLYERDITFIGDNLGLAQDFYYAQKLGVKQRYLEADLNGGTLYFDGDKYRSSTGNVAFSRMKLGLFSGMVRRSNQDSFFIPAVTGRGQVQLNDTFKFITMIKVKNPSRYILENGVYLGSAGNFKFGVHTDAKLKSLMFSKKTMFTTEITGQGVLILELPVAPAQLEVFEVTPDSPVRVNGRNVLFREGNVARDYKMASTVFGSLASGAGWVEEYTGTGRVYLAPTANVFTTLEKDFGKSALDKKPVSVWHKWFGHDSDRGNPDSVNSYKDNQSE